MRKVLKSLNDNYYMMCSYKMTSFYFKNYMNE